MSTNVNAIVEQNLGLLRQCAHNWAKTGMEWEEAYQEGAFGLMHAAEHFDETCGLAFSTYAIKCINGYIAKSRRKQTNGAMLPHYLEEKRVAIRREMLALAEDGKEPTPAAVAAKVGLPVDKVEAVMSNLSAMVAMDAVNENGSTLAETIADSRMSVEDQLAHDQLEDVIRTTMLTEAIRNKTLADTKKTAEKGKKNFELLMETLTEKGLDPFTYITSDAYDNRISPAPLTAKQRDAVMRKADVVISRYIHSQTLQDVADELNLTRERVRQLEVDGLQLLKNSKEFREFLVP